MAQTRKLVATAALVLGFSVSGRDASGRPNYVDGVQGVAERNTMRFFLAIDTFLQSLALPPEQRHERRLHEWFAVTERYPMQLHEMVWTSIWQ
jgi:hypothetical protein